MATTERALHNVSQAVTAAIQQQSNTDAAIDQLDASAKLAIILGSSIAGSLLILSMVCVAFVVWKRRRADGNNNDDDRDSTTISKAVPVPKSPNQAGVLQNERIEFVLPTSYTSAEPTEEEASEHEPGHYRYSYIHGAPGGTLLAVPNQNSRRGITTDSIAPALYFSSEGEEEPAAWFPPHANLGKVGFSLRYRSQHQQLVIRIIGATNLPTGKRRKGVSHPHVKITVLPDKQPKLFTKVLKNMTEPIFNEDFMVPLKPEDAQNKILKLTMCDFDKFSRRIAVGHIFLPLKTLGLTSASKDTVLLGEMWKNLVPKYLDSEEIRGEISLSLCYNPDIRNLRLGIHKVKNLNSGQEDKDIACLFSKVTLLEDGKVIKTRKTSAKKKTFEPDFAETFNIKVQREKIQNVFCTVSVCSRNRYGTRSVVGRTQIGPFTLVSGPGADHWNDAFQSPKSTVTQWHVLR